MWTVSGPISIWDMGGEGIEARICMALSWREKLALHHADRSIGRWVGYGAVVSSQPIADHALLSDCHSAVLVDKRGSVEWWCLPRFDSPSVFGRILDDGAGHFAVTPRDITSVSRSYESGTLVLTTSFRTSSGTVELTDALAMAEGVRDHDLGKGSPHTLLRRLTCVEGTVELDVEFAPRAEYGLTEPLLTEVPGGVLARGGAAALRLTAPGQYEVDGSKASASLTIAEGEVLTFAVSSGSSWEEIPPHWSREQVLNRIDDTIEAWRSWERAHQTYDGPYRDLVAHSGRVLYGLTYRPTGALIAAPTTSLPEAVGGERNWDYRYSWVRDASLTMDALWVAACPDEAKEFLDYLTTAASSFKQRGELQIMFGIRGERDLSERELFWLSGWRDSAPVRIGNGAWSQRQLDVYGELLAAVHRLKDQFGDFDRAERELLVGAADASATVWTDTDRGIWEVRGEPRHYLHSKLMCWVALDRAIELSDALQVDEDRKGTWSTARDDVRDWILDRGWNPDVASFTQTPDGDALDASALLIPIVGFLPADDPRVLGTIDAIAEHLTSEQGLVYRYRVSDGLEGEEGAFLLCSFWLVEALALAGRFEEAIQRFEAIIGYCNDVGLLAEEVDAVSGEQLGNFPQAFSHVGLVNAAWAIGKKDYR